jgi:hypothetical protein
MDDLGAMLPTMDYNVQQAARQRIRWKYAQQQRHCRHPDNSNTVWPSAMTAFMTPAARSCPVADRLPSWISRHSIRSYLETLKTIIKKKGDYVEGFFNARQWVGRLGWNSSAPWPYRIVGVYYYDVYKPDSWMELNQCQSHGHGRTL